MTTSVSCKRKKFCGLSQLVLQAVWELRTADPNRPVWEKTVLWALGEEPNSVLAGSVSTALGNWAEKGKLKRRLDFVSDSVFEKVFCYFLPDEPVECPPFYKKGRMPPIPILFDEESNEGEEEVTTFDPAEKQELLEVYSKEQISRVTVPSNFKHLSLEEFRILNYIHINHEVSYRALEKAFGSGGVAKPLASLINRSEVVVARIGTSEEGKWYRPYDAQRFPIHTGRMSHEDRMYIIQAALNHESCTARSLAQELGMHSARASAALAFGEKIGVLVRSPIQGRGPVPVWRYTRAKTATTTTTAPPLSTQSESGLMKRGGPLVCLPNARSIEIEFGRGSRIDVAPEELLALHAAVSAKLSELGGLYKVLKGMLEPG